MANTDTDYETGRRPQKKWKDDERDEDVESMLDRIDNDSFREAVTKYAKSQNVDINEERVLKYARGLLGPTGDFGGREQDAPIGRRK